MRVKHPTGMVAFTTVWIGQILSLIGTGMTGFALIIWIYQKTGQATALGLMAFSLFLPTVLLSPLAGALVDRGNRKLVMMISDLGAGLATAVVLTIYFTGHLEIWHLYVTGAFTGATQAFQFLAYSAAVSTMLRKEQYARANGMISLAEGGAFILAPILAGILIGPIGIGGILMLDLLTFFVALGTLLIVHIPQPRVTVEGEAAKGSLWTEALYGFRYIWARPSLMGMQVVFLVLNLTVSLGMPIREALVLARTGNDAAMLGSVLSVGAVGGVVGGLAVSLWGGPKNKVHGVLLSMILQGLLGMVVYGLARDFIFWAAGAFIMTCAVTILNASNQALWQAKVAPDVQGRVFATRRLIAQIAGPVGMLAGGPLADRLFTPAMMEGGALAPVLGGLFGTGAGAGMSVMFALTGVLGAVAAATAYGFRAVREAERLLPDHDTIESAVMPVPALGTVEAEATT